MWASTRRPRFAAQTVSGVYGLEGNADQMMERAGKLDQSSRSSHLIIRHGCSLIISFPPRSANPNPCQLPMSTGEGFARLERFYYDPASKSCKSFTYKGLKGNQNNFLTLVSFIQIGGNLHIHYECYSQRACQLACLPLDSEFIFQFKIIYNSKP
jgi:hypothetical protein